MQGKEPTTLEVCVDCLSLLANGEVTDGNGNDITALHAEKMRAQWGDTEITLGRIREPRYVVIENTPGYLPDDDDPAVFDSIDDAKEYIKEEVERYIDFLVEGVPDGTPDDEVFSVWWSEDLTEAYVSDLSKIHDLGRNFSIDEVDPDDDDEPWFSSQQCDGCGSTLGGDREYATAWTEVK